MKKLSIVASFYLLFMFIPSFSFSTQPTIAVLDFENNSFFNPEEYNPLSRGLAEIMITELQQVKTIHVVERAKLRSILDELKLSQSGLVSQENSIRVGKLLGAQHLVFGGYIVAMNEKIRIDVRIVEVETGLVIKAGEVTGKAKQILSLVQKLSKKILKDLNIKMTKAEEQTLEKSQKLDMKAVVLFSKGIEFEDKNQREKAIEFYNKALAIEPEFRQAKMRIQKLTEEEKKS